ncbi:MAG: caspase family protein [Bacteroidota bacterium]
MRFPNTTSICLFGVLLAFLLPFQVAIGQSTWVPGTYYGIPDQDKQVAFLDDFNNNSQNWDLGSVYLAEQIENGRFYVASRTSHRYTKRRIIPVNQDGNYEVEIRMRFVRGTQSKVGGLTFGRNAKGSEYNFLINNQQQFKLMKYDRGREHTYINWKYSRHLEKYSYNTLLIRKVDNHWYFFINQFLVEKVPAKELFGSEFGFSIGGHIAVEVDYLKVAEIKTVDINGPEITILDPQVVTNSSVIRLPNRNQIIRGKVRDVSGITSVTINNHPITLSSDGVFKASLSLPNGIHVIKIVAKDRYDNVSTRVLRLEYLPQGAKPTMVQHTPLPKKPLYQPMPQGKGKNYLLLIGINTYQYWNKLHNAVKDCEDLAHTLTAYYHFEKENVITLYNDEATRENILETFEHLQEAISEDDNLLIYYAGHGYYDTYSQLGYWVPAEARLNKIPDFIRNSTIHDYLRTIGTQHTLLIADACYAGSLFAAYRGTLDENSRSRWAFTSGDIEKVWDGQPGQNSPFASYLINYLKDNRKAKLPADELIKNVRGLVQRNTAQTPQGSPLKQAGDAGGVFVFYRR